MEAPPPCTCSILKEKAESLKTTIEKLQVENARLQAENGKFRLLTVEASVTNSQVADEGDEDGTEDEDGCELKMVDGVFHMADEYSPASRTCENPSPKTDEQDDPDRPDEEDQSQELQPRSWGSQESAWTPKGLWKCAVCEKNIRGNRSDRWNHIIVHKNFKVSCPFDGCGKLFSLKGLKANHIPRCHYIKSRNISQPMKEQLRSDGAKIMAEAKKFEHEFFPAENILKVGKLDNEICKKCNATVKSTLGQQNHIATHLKWTVLCPVPECIKQSSVAVMYEHFRDDHSPLSEEIHRKWIEARKVYLSVIAEAKELYF